MITSHGSYPFDPEMWGSIWTIIVHPVPKKAVEAFIHAATPTGEVLSKSVPNKEFRVVQGFMSRVVAVYQHDGKYSLISAYTDEFLKADRKRHEGMKSYKTPQERLWYPQKP